MSSALTKARNSETSLQTQTVHHHTLLRANRWENDQVLSYIWDYNILLWGFYVGPEGSCKHWKLLLVTGLDEYVHDITWLVNSKETFLQLFYSMSRRVMYHFERSVSLTHLHDFKKIEKKIKKRKNLTTQHYEPGRVETVISVLPGSRVQ